MGFFSNTDLLTPRKGELSGPGTRRVTRLPIYIVVGAVSLFALIVVTVGYKRAEVSPDRDETRVKLSSSKSMAEELTRGHIGLIPSDEVKTPPHSEPIPTSKEETPSVPVATREAPMRETLPIPTPRKVMPYEEDMKRFRAVRLQMLEQALQSKTGVQSGANYPRTFSGSAQPNREDVLAQIANTRKQIATISSDEPTKAYKQRLEMLRRSGLLPSETSGPAPTSFPVSTKRTGSEIGLPGNPSGDRWLLDGQGVTTPRTPFELRAGFIIPAIMLSGINSDLPGQVIAQVSQNVFDSATGKHLVIPQGTRLLGSYGSDVIFGQERVLMAWQRLVFPDGKALDIGSMPGADSAGYAGFHDQVNSHMFRTIMSAFLLSGVVAGINLSQDRGGDSDNQRASDALSEALGQTLGQAMAQMIMKNLNVAPTLEIRPGYRFNVMVVKDIPFQRPYKSFDY